MHEAVMALLFVWAVIGYFAWFGWCCRPAIFYHYAWRLVEHRPLSGWLVHLLFGPFLIFGEWLITDLLFLASGDDGKGSPGLGFVVILPFVVCLITLVAYYAKVSLSVLKRLRAKQF
jgi:hypothetical protein